MQVVSADYLTAIKATVRDIVIRVEIGFLDNEILGSRLTVSGDEQESLVAVERAIDGKATLTRDLAFADPYDESDPGGNARVFPADDLYPCTEEAGWWGDTLSDANGDIAGGETLTLEYDSAIDVKTFRVWSNEFLGMPVDFTIDYWDGTAWVNVTAEVGNDEANYEVVLSSMINTAKVRLAVTKMNHPKCSAKCLEFEGGFTEDVTERVNYLEIVREREAEGTVPVGNVSTAELTLELDNSDGVYYRRSGSVYAGYLTANRKIRVWAGCVLADGTEEMVELGEFFTRSWKASAGEVLAYVKAWDRSKRMKEERYSTSTVVEGKRIDELVAIVAEAYGLIAADMVLDVSATTVEYAWFESKSFWSHLSDLAIGEGGSIYFDGNGKLRFENREHLAGQTVSVATLTDLDLIEDIEEAWEQDRLRNKVVVPVRPLTMGSETEVYNLATEITVPAGGTKSLTVYYAVRPVMEVQTPVITGGANVSIDSWTAYAWGGSLVLANAGGSDEAVTAITISGKPLEELGGLRAVAFDATSIEDYGTRTYTIPDAGSRFIQDLSVAETMADDLLDVMGDPGAEVPVSGRGRPELEIADRVTVEDEMLSISNDYWILRMVLKYDGGLSAEYVLLEAG